MIVTMFMTMFVLHMTMFVFMYDNVCLQYDNVCLCLVVAIPQLLHSVWRSTFRIGRFCCRFELHSIPPPMYDHKTSAPLQSPLLYMTMFVYTMTMFICSMTMSVLYVTMFVYSMTMFVFMFVLTIYIAWKAGVATCSRPRSIPRIRLPL